MKWITDLISAVKMQYRMFKLRRALKKEDPYIYK